MADTEVTEVTGEVVDISGRSAGHAQNRVIGIVHPSHRGGRGRHITDLLAEFGYVTQEQVSAAIKEARSSPSLSPKQILLDRGLVSPDQVSRVVAERLGLDFIDLDKFKINFAAANLVSVETARRYKAVPVEFIGDDSILLAITDPANVLALDDLGILTGRHIVPAVASPTDVESLIGQLTKFDDSIEAAIQVNDKDEPEEITDIHETAEDAPVIRLTHTIISQALEARASDIHFEPGEHEMSVRFRVDGVLEDATTLPKRMIAGVTSRVKIMADLNIAEHRLPQDGRVTMKIDGRPVDIRVVTLPSSHGETVVMRLLEKDASLLDLHGLEGRSLEWFQQAIGKPYGATLVTGPTGSGKTTTLYSGLQRLNTRDKSILTIEDPIEYQMPGVTQIQVHVKAGLTFSAGLRSMLRADPDVIMVGEIRDRETARIAIEAALTGHLVLSTLHTNSAPAAVSRLIDMGIEPFLIASALDCIVAQRLVRMLCSNCKRPVQLSVDLLRSSGFTIGDNDKIEGFGPVGCGRCGGDGFKGRTGIFEVMRVSERIRALTLSLSSADEIRAQARKEGMYTLREDGLEKVRQGLSSVEEVTRVIS